MYFQVNRQHLSNNRGQSLLLTKARSHRAQELIKYNQAHPEAAHRIISMAESQEAHRQKLETFGLIFGFVIVIMVTGAGTLLIFNDKPGTGLVIALSGIATLVWPFVVSHRTKKEERVQDGHQ